MKSYRPEELFDASGKLIDELQRSRRRAARRRAPTAYERRPALKRPPDAGFQELRAGLPSPGKNLGFDMRELGKFLRERHRPQQRPAEFKMFSPDETLSNPERRFEATDRKMERRAPPDGRIHRAGRVRSRFDAQRASVPGLARRIPAHRPARQYSSVTRPLSDRGFHGQPAREMVEGDVPAALARRYRLPQISDHLARLAAGPQRL
jgi:hypothetical protein